MNSKTIWKKIEVPVIMILCGVTLLFDFFKINILENELHNRYVCKILQQGIGAIAVVLLLIRLKVKLFGKPQGWIFLLIGCIVAIDNFQWSSYLTGKMTLVNDKLLDFLLFGGYCLSVGMFEECIFRGVILSCLANYFPKDKGGFWKTYLVSSLVFAAAHILNGFSIGTILQVGYTFLTGGLFGFVLIKTKNIFCCGFVHGLYNFCGLLFENSDYMGLGNGVVFDVGTVITMFIISVLAGLFVLNAIKKVTDEEQAELYEKLGVSMKKE